MKIGPSRNSCRSVPQMPHQSTLTLTVPALVSGTGRSSMRMSPRPWASGCRYRGRPWQPGLLGDLPQCRRGDYCGSHQAVQRSGVEVEEGPT
jgi:hypothetical protein